MNWHKYTEEAIDARADRDADIERRAFNAGCVCGVLLAVVVAIVASVAFAVTVGLA